MVAFILRSYHGLVNIVEFYTDITEIRLNFALLAYSP